MPSPFPGMDPFLEDPAIFPDLHHTYTVLLSAALNAVLPPPYYCAICSFTWQEVTPQEARPDLIVGRESADNLGLDEPIVVHVETEEERQIYLEIHSQPGCKRPVAVVELVSPANKVPDGYGRSAYMKKQREILQSQVHLVEIDLLRGGVHTTAVPLAAAVERAGSFDYHVCVHFWDQPTMFYVYTIPLQRRLPVVAVPLLPGDPPVRVDLGAVLNRAYESAQYHRLVSYGGQVPSPPLRSEQAAWVEQTLRAAGVTETDAGR